MAVPAATGTIHANIQKEELDMGLRERLGKEWLFCDGGTGSILQGMGLKGGELPELWNLNRPDDIVALNRAYFEAGSNIVNTNTFGANRLKMYLK